MNPTEIQVVFNTADRPELINPYLFLVKAMDELGTAYCPADILDGTLNMKSPKRIDNQIEAYFDCLRELRALYSR